MGAAVEAPTSVCNGRMLRVLSSDLLSLSNMPLPILGIGPCMLVALGSRNLLKREASAHPQSKIQNRNSVQVPLLPPTPTSSPPYNIEATSPGAAEEVAVGLQSGS